MPKYLHISKKSCKFAAEYENNSKLKIQNYELRKRYREFCAIY